MSRFPSPIKSVSRNDELLDNSYQDEVLESWRNSLDLVGRELRRRDRPAIETVTLILESLPLTTAEFATARLRLSNVLHYSRIGEWGASRYELRLLATVGCR